MSKIIEDDVRKEFINDWSNKENKRVLITHNGCMDGVGTAAVGVYFSLLKYLFDVEVKYLNYNDYDIKELATICKDAVVYVGDFSFMGAEYDILNEVSKNFVIVDHHDTPYNNPVSEKHNTHFDKTKSGAYLAYEFFFKDVVIANLFEPVIGKLSTFNGNYIPTVIKYISDRDLYQFEYGIKTKALHMLLSEQQPNNHTKVIEFIINPHRLEDAIMPYIDKVEAYEAKCVSRAKDAVLFTISGVEFYGLNLTTAISDTLNVVSKTHNKPSMAYWVKENEIQFSLRNGSDVKINLAKLAEVFGGGGHPSAAGFTIKFRDIDLEEFFTNRNIN